MVVRLYSRKTKKKNIKSQKESRILPVRDRRWVFVDCLGALGCMVMDDESSEETARGFVKGSFAVVFVAGGLPVIVLFVPRSGLVIYICTRAVDTR